jgi:hypothetical protein
MPDHVEVEIFVNGEAFDFEVCPLDHPPEIDLQIVDLIPLLEPLPNEMEL